MTIAPLPTSGGDADLPMSATTRTSTTYLYVVSILSAVGGFLFGYDTGIVSGAMIFVRPHFNLNEVWQEAIVSITVAGAWIFSLVSGHLTERFGRRPVILAASVIFTVGSIVMGASESKEMLLIGRLVVGMAIGMASMCVPMYIAEVAPPDVRGNLVTINACFITGGQFIAAIVAGAFSYDHENGWRYMLGLAGVPSLIQFIGFLFMPESPRWLVAQGREQDAVRALQRLRSTNELRKEERERARIAGDQDAIMAAIQEEINAIKTTVDQAAADKTRALQRSDSRMAGSVAARVFASPGVRRALLVGCMLTTIQQLAGINTVMYYSATILEMSGIDDKSQAVWMASATAAVNFVFTFVGFFAVERIGRRALTLSSLAGVCLSLMLLAVGFQLASDHSIPITSNSTVQPWDVDQTADAAELAHCNQYKWCMDCATDSRCGFCYSLPPGVKAMDLSEVEGACVPASDDSDKSLGGLCGVNGPDYYGGTNTTYKYIFETCPVTKSTEVYAHLILAGMLVYLFFFAPGMGPMPWTINSEIYPLWARSFCFSAATSVNWLFNLIVSMTFLSLTSAITRQGAFYLYGGISMVGLVFFWFFLPETKGRDLDDIETLFSMSIKARRASEAFYNADRKSQGSIDSHHRDSGHVATREGSTGGHRSRTQSRASRSGSFSAKVASSVGQLPTHVPLKGTHLQVSDQIEQEESDRIEADIEARNVISLSVPPLHQVNSSSPTDSSEMRNRGSTGIGTYGSNGTLPTGQQSDNTVHQI